MEEKRRKPSYKEGKPERWQRMNEPIVYEKALNKYETVVFRDKIGGEYTVYVVQHGSVDLEKVEYKTTEHIYECPSFDKK